MNFETKREQPGGQNTLETKAYSSKEKLIKTKFLHSIEVKNIDVKTLNTRDAIRQALIKSHAMKPGVDIEDVLDEIGIIYKPPIENIKKNVLIPNEEIYQPTIYSKRTEVKDPNVLKIVKDNESFLAIKDIVKNDEELNLIHEQALSLEGIDPTETATIGYYNKFADSGMIEGGRDEVKKDFQDLENKNTFIQERRKKLTKEDASQEEWNKKIATILECSFAYGISNLKWFGKNVCYKKTCEFDDKFRGTDGVLYRIKENNENYFNGIGIDITSCNYLGEDFKVKFFRVLQSIHDGGETEIKYFTNHKGRMMKEFSVPEVILPFERKDVKDLINMVKNANKQGSKEKFENSPLRFTVIKRIKAQCDLLIDFAKKYGENKIMRKYIEAFLSFKDTLQENPEMKKILDEGYEDNVSNHMKYLIKEFEELEKVNQKVA
jgi:hypothetical protein